MRTVQSGAAAARWVGRRSATTPDVPALFSLPGDRGSPGFKGATLLKPPLFRAVSDTVGSALRTAAGGPRKPRNGERASWGPEPGAEGPAGTGCGGTPAVISRVCGPELAGGAWVPFGLGAGPVAGTLASGLPRPVHGDFGPGDPGQLCTRSRVSSDCVVTAGRVVRGTIVTPSRLCVGGAVTCGVPSPSFCPGRAHFLLSVPDVWEARSEVCDCVPATRPQPSSPWGRQ